MVKNEGNPDYFHSNLNDLHFLDDETDSMFLEWFRLEGSERINQLTRQLRTFLNYKSSIIRLRFTRLNDFNRSIKKDDNNERETEFISLTSRFIFLLKKIGIEEGEVHEKFQIFINKVKTHSNNLEIKQLKEIKHISSEIWKIIHILSELEFYNNLKLLPIAIKVACILCSIEGVFFPVYTDFYRELKYNYLQLDKEISALLSSEEDNQIKKKKKMRWVGVLE
jgi:hypothetical protein